MKNKKKSSLLNISIVLYNNKNFFNYLKPILKISFNKLYIIDNSPDNIFENLKNLKQNVKYISPKKNLGYGKAHNIALRKSIEDNIKYHLILNPDVIIEKKVLNKLINYLDTRPEVGLIMPKILYPDGKVQYLAKLLPTPFDLILRRFIPLKTIRNKLTTKYELRFTGYDKIMNVPFLSGCFMLFRTSVLNEIGFFDERYFMYMEDVDISRRIHKKYKTIFYPYVTIIHNYEKGSYKNFKLLSYHISSAIKYFNKWGWFFDKERKFINKKFLNEYYRSNV